MPFVLSSGWVPLKADYESHPAAKAVKEAVPQSLGAAGLVHAYRGKAVDASEGPAAEMYGVFESVDAARKSREGSDAAATKKAFEELVDPGKKPVDNIFELHSDFAPVAAAPVVQQAAWIVPLAQKDAFDAEWAKVFKTDAKIDGMVAGTHGWGLTEVDDEGGKAKIFLTAVGWESTAKAEAAKDEGKKHAAGLEKLAKPHVRFVNLEKLK